jgi:hypothetical protein
VKRTRQNTVEAGCWQIISCRHRAPNLFRACRTHFQLPQAILANGVNWLIPKIKALLAVRCPKAGDGSASRTRVLCLALTLPLRDRRCAKVYPYAIGSGRMKASPIARRFQTPPPAHQPDFAGKNRTHRISLRQSQMHRNARRRFSSRRAGKKGTSQQSAPILQPQTGTLVAFQPAKPGQADVQTVFRLNGANRSCLPCCNRLTVTQSAMEGQYFCENFGYRRCRLCRRDSRLSSCFHRPSTDSLR